MFAIQHFKKTRRTNPAVCSSSHEGKKQNKIKPPTGQQRAPTLFLRDNVDLPFDCLPLLCAWWAASVQTLCGIAQECAGPPLPAAAAEPTPGTGRRWGQLGEAVSFLPRSAATSPGSLTSENKRTEALPRLVDSSNSPISFFFFLEST